MAIALAASSCAPSAALAVQIAADGIGDVLLFPFYTARPAIDGDFVTLVTIVNASDTIKATKVRLREGDAGLPALEFTLYLTPRDTWVGAILPTEFGAGIVTPDDSCTDPPISRDENAPTLLGRNAEGAQVVPADKTREGYLEVFQLGDYGTSLDAPAGSIPEALRLTSRDGRQVPTDCARIVGDTGMNAVLAPGSIAGSAVHIQVAQGVETVVPAVALTHFNVRRTLWFTPSTNRPGLADADPAVSIVHHPVLGTVRTEWQRPIEAVSAILSASAITGDYLLDRATASQTAWVVTLPTRPHHVVDGQPTLPPFVTSPSVLRQCEPAASERWGFIADRDGSTAPVGGIGVPPPNPPRGFCFVTTVAEFQANALYDSPHAWGLIDTQKPFQAPSLPIVAIPGLFSFENGTFRVPLHLDALPPRGDISTNLIPKHAMQGGATQIFRHDGTVESRPAATYFGLPMIGFVASTFRNGTLQLDSGPVLANYAGAQPFRIERRIE